MTDWPHAPPHRLTEAGAYMITAGTYQKQHLFRGRERLSFLQTHLFALAEHYGWTLHAWAIFSNHYHAVLDSASKPETLRHLIRHLHSVTAREVNRIDNTPGRTVWHQYWDTHLTFQRSYLARLSYVHQNAVRHGLVANAADYPWCSAAWFAEHAAPGFYNAVMGLKTDRITVRDDFAPA